MTLDRSVLPVGLLAPTLIVYVATELASPNEQPVLDGTKIGLLAGLPPGTGIELHRAAERPSRDLRSDARSMYITLTWDATNQTVAMKVLGSEGSVQLEREMRFSPQDSLRERGRASGLALAAMLASLAPSAASDVAPPAEQRSPEAPPDPAPRTQPAEPRAPPQPPTTAPRNYAIHFALASSFGLGGTAGGLGGTLGIERRLAHGWGLYGYVRILRSEVSEVQSNATFSQAGVGASFGSAFGANDRFTASIGGHVAAEWQYLSHFSGDEPVPEAGGRVLPVLAARVAAGWRFSEVAGVYLSAGPDLAFGKTDLYVKGKLASHIPLFRASADAGFRLFF